MYTCTCARRRSAKATPTHSQKFTELFQVDKTHSVADINVRLCRGKYADVPLVSESVYMQVEASEYM